jgi:hypothetical protein
LVAAQPAVAAGATVENTRKQRAFDNFFVQPAVARTWRQVTGEPDK